jgi:hypothetical protein
MLCTLEPFAVLLLYMLVGPTSELYKSYKTEMIDEYDNFYLLIEMHVASLPKSQIVYMRIMIWRIQLQMHAH